MEQYTIAKYLYKLMTDKEMEYKKEVFFKECQNSQIVRLWRILFETDMSDTELLKDRIYEFGSNIKSQDYVGREVFLCLVALLNLVIK